MLTVFLFSVTFIEVDTDFCNYLIFVGVIYHSICKKKLYRKHKIINKYLLVNTVYLHAEVSILNKLTARALLCVLFNQLLFDAVRKDKLIVSLHCKIWEAKLWINI
jgi:hypothetical protein